MLKPFLFDSRKVERVLCSSLNVLFDFSQVKRVLCSRISCSTSVKSNEFCVQAFAVLFDFSKVERVLCSRLSLLDFTKVE